MAKAIKLRFDVGNSGKEVLDIWKSIQKSEEQLGENLKYEVEYSDNLTKSTEAIDIILLLLYGLDGIAFIQDFLIDLIISLFQKKNRTIHIKLKDGTELTYNGDEDIEEITKKLKELGSLVSKNDNKEDIVISFRE